MKNTGSLTLAVALAMFITHIHAATLGTAFTYQGRLEAGTNRAAGSYDLMFALHDAPAAGTMVAGPVTNAAVTVSDGVFTTLGQHFLVANHFRLCVAGKP